jgi:hypothetical protein
MGKQVDAFNLTLALFNYIAPLQEAGQKVTKEPDANGVTG